MKTTIKLMLEAKLEELANKSEENQEKNLYPKDIIKTIILGTMSDVIKKDKNYFSFVLVPIVISFLGKCISKDKTFNQNENESDDFNRCIKELMPKEYSNVNKKINLYSKFRNGMLNMLRPKKGVGFTHSEEAKKFKVSHLDIEDDSVVLVIEDLWKDVETAAKKVLKMKFADNDKMNKPFIGVPK